METLISHLQAPPSDTALVKMWNFLLPLASDRGSEELRTKAVKCGLVCLATFAKAELREKVKGDMNTLLGQERSSALKEVLEGALKVDV